MTDDEIYEMVETKAAEAYRTPQGPDYKSIAQEVADETGATFEHVRSLCLDRWTSMARTG